MRFRLILKKIVETKEEMGRVMKASFFSLAQVGGWVGGGGRTFFCCCSHTCLAVFGSGVGKSTAPQQGRPKSPPHQHQQALGPRKGSPARRAAQLLPLHGATACASARSLLRRAAALLPLQAKYASGDFKHTVFDSVDQVCRGLSTVRGRQRGQAWRRGRDLWQLPGLRAWASLAPAASLAAACAAKAGEAAHQAVLRCCVVAGIGEGAGQPGQCRRREAAQV
jgi:hypothetical protein